MRHTFIFISFLVINLNNILAQTPCNPDLNISPAMDCQEALNAALAGNGTGYVCDLNGYCSRMVSGDWGNETYFCSGTGVLNNPNWFSFRANSTIIDLDVTITNCDVITVFDPIFGNQYFSGVQWGLYNQCANPDNAIRCDAQPGADDGETFKIRYTNAIVGNLYIVLLDGKRGSICDYKIEVNQGIGTTFVEKQAGAKIDGPISLCKNSVVKYTAKGLNFATKYSWSINTQTISSNGNELSFDLSTLNLPNGIYDICAKATNECDQSGQEICQQIEIRDAPKLDVETLVCAGTSFTFRGKNYVAGNYSIEIKDVNNSGCDTICTLIVKENEIIRNNKIQSVINCNSSDQLTINGQLCSDPNGCDIIFTAQNGCDSIVQYRITDLKAQGKITSQPELLPCYGGEALLEIKDLKWNIIPDNYSVKWINDQDQIVDNLVNKAGKYDVIISTYFNNSSIVTGDSMYCEEKISYDLKVDEKNTIPVYLPEDAWIKLGDSLLLKYTTDIDPQFIDSITWSNKSGLIDCFNCPEITVSPITETNYFLEITDKSGCVSEDEITVRVRVYNNVFVPNVFSPNGDGFNDYLYIQSDLSVVKIKRFSIFNRWGENIFTISNIFPNDESAGWNGKYKGSNVLPDTYIYFAELEFINGRKEVIKGVVNVVN